MTYDLLSRLLYWAKIEKPQMLKELGETGKKDEAEEKKDWGGDETEGPAERRRRVDSRERTWPSLLGNRHLPERSWHEQRRGNCRMEKRDGGGGRMSREVDSSRNKRSEY